MDDLAQHLHIGVVHGLRLPGVKRFIPALLLVIWAAPALLASDPSGAGSADPDGSGSGCLLVELELPREFLLFNPDLPPGAECEPSLFVIALDASEGDVPARPQRLECRRLEAANPGALVRFESAPIQLSAGAHELFLWDAGYAVRVELTGAPQVVAMVVPEPVAVRLVPEGADGALGASPQRILWRVDAGPAAVERVVERPMREARPACDGVGFVLLGCGGRLSLEDPCEQFELEQPAELLVHGPVELSVGWCPSLQE